LLRHISTATHTGADRAARHLTGRPVGPPARWAATSNVGISQMTYPPTGEGYEGRGEKGARDKVTKRRRGKEVVEWGRGP